MEVLFVTYDIVRLFPAHTIQQEHQFLSATIIDWAKLCREKGYDGLCAGQLSENRRS